MIVLTNGTIIDGIRKAPDHAKATVIMDRNRIVDIGYGLDYPKEARIIDLNGLFMMPGLIDSHVHCGGVTHLEPGKPNFVGRKGSADYVDFRECSITNGVTTSRSVGDYFPDIVNVRDEISEGKIPGPRIVASGPLFTAPGGHPGHTIMGGVEECLRHAVREVEDPETARDEVRKLVEGGVDFIKAVIATEDIFNRRPIPRLSPKVLEAVGDEAHRCGRRFVVHAEDHQATIEAVRAGADSIEHVSTIPNILTELSDDIIRMILDKGVYIVPTLSIISISDGKLPGMPLRYEDTKKNFKKLYDAGAKISAGTDAGGPETVFGEMLHLELELMVESGMTPIDAIFTATRNAAENLGKEKELGTIEKGKLADIIVVSGNPLEHITDARNVKLVIKNGEVMLDKMAGGET